MLKTIKVSIICTLLTIAPIQYLSANHCRVFEPCSKIYPDKPPPKGSAWECHWPDGYHYSCHLVKTLEDNKKPNVEDDKKRWQGWRYVYYEYWCAELRRTERTGRDFRLPNDQKQCEAKCKRMEGQLLNDDPETAAKIPACIKNSTAACLEQCKPFLCC